METLRDEKNLSYIFIEKLCSLLRLAQLFFLIVLFLIPQSILLLMIINISLVIIDILITEKLLKKSITFLAIFSLVNYIVTFVGFLFI